MARKTYYNKTVSTFSNVYNIFFNKRNSAFDWLIKKQTMAFRSDISVAITACLLGIAFASSTTHRETLSKLKALQSLVFNNAQATVTLDSTALKQLVKLASSGKSSQPLYFWKVFIDIILSIRWIRKKYLLTVPTKLSFSSLFDVFERKFTYLLEEWFYSDQAMLVTKPTPLGICHFNDWTFYLIPVKEVRLKLIAKRENPRFPYLQIISCFGGKKLETVNL